MQTYLPQSVDYDQVLKVALGVSPAIKASSGSPKVTPLLREEKIVTDLVKISEQKAK